MDTANNTIPACAEEIARRAVRCPHCTSRQPDAPLMHRNVPGRVLGGVCAAISLQLGIDAVLVRVAFVVSLAVSAGLSFWIYGLLWVLTPFETDGVAPFVQAFDWLKRLFRGVDAETPSQGDNPPV
jgi:phage shock protein PspC (stress-responsive transcriptional regulator)